MESITPSIEDPKDIVQIDGDDITANLFKNVSLPPKIDKLETYLRIRPVKEPRAKIYFIKDNRVITIKKERKEDQTYEFSRIFNEDTTQETVYKYCAQPLVSKFMEGNDSLLFAYGTTSSGKSYTIRGEDTNPGVIQRVLRTLFTALNVSKEPLYKRKNFRDFEILNSDEKILEVNMKQRYLSLSQKLPNIQKSVNHFKAIEVEKEHSFDENTTFVFWVSFIEFYNDKPIDLLALDGDFQKMLKIYDNGAVQGLKHIFVSSAEEAFRIFLYGQARLNDHIKSNGLNLQSSRSHAMFTITAIAVNTRSQRAFRVNNLSVCDLAGNERSNKTQSKGDRLKEAGKINMSLLSLQNVIKGLRTSQKNKKDNSFVSYRDSKLTRSFKPFLDGTGFASMIINMNPSANLTEETIGSLDFSATAAEVVVSTQDSRKQCQDSWKRLSQQWISSKQRWSSFAESRKTLKFNVGDILLEEIEEEEVSVNEIDGEIQRLSMVVPNCVDEGELNYYKERIEILNSQIEMMNERIEEAETEQFRREMEIRNELADKNRELSENLIRKHAAEKEKLRSENDEFMEKRLQIAHAQREREKIELEKKLESRDKQIFELREKLIELECKLSVSESKEYQEKSTSTNIVTLDVGNQTVPYQEYSLHNDSLSLLSLALPPEAKTYCDVSCGDVRRFEDKCVETDVDCKQVKDQNLSIHPETDEKFTSISLYTVDTCTQSEPTNTTEESSNTTVTEVMSKSIQCEDVVEHLSNQSTIELLNKSVQCDDIQQNSSETTNTKEESSNTSVTELMSKSIQCEDVVEHLSTIELLNKSVQYEQNNSVTEPTLFHSLANESDSSEEKETTKVIDFCSMSTQTDNYEDTNERTNENLRKQVKEKDALLSLKEDVIAKLQSTIKTKNDELEKMSASSVASSQQSMLSAYGEPYRPKKPKIMLSDPVDQVYLETMSAREKEMKNIESVKKFQKNILESATKVVETGKKSSETGKKSFETGKKSSETGRKNSDTSKKNVEVAKKASERPKRSTRKKSEPEQEVEEEEPIDDDIGAAVFSAGKSNNHTLRGRKREKIDKCDEEITTKRMKMPNKEKRHLDSISPITEVEDNKQRKAYNFRSRKQLYKN